MCYTETCPAEVVLTALSQKKWRAASAVSNISKPFLSFLRAFLAVNSKQAPNIAVHVVWLEPAASLRDKPLHRVAVCVSRECVPRNQQC